jgi:pimeloyl-ACP methyl ester carboxylesterase
MHPYDCTVVDPSFEMHLIATTSHRSHYTVVLPLAQPGSWAKDNTIFGDLFIPPDMKSVPMAILVSGLGDESMIPCLMIARHLVKQGIAAFVLRPVIRSSQEPETLNGDLLPSTPEEWLDAFKVSVTHIRRVIDWSIGRDEVDEKRIAVIGASMGGMISAVAMGVDQRISSGVFITTGGNLEEISWEGKNEAVRVGHNCTREECHEVYSKYPRYLDDVAQKGLHNITPSKECFLFDPLTFAAFLRNRRLLMINALQDEVIPKHSATHFWEACGKPQIVWLYATHTSIFSQQATINKEISSFLKLTFKM